jgi:hypothetical protein
VAVVLLSHGLKGNDALSVNRRLPDAEVLELNVPVMVTENASGPASEDVEENVLPVMLCGGLNSRVLTASTVPQLPERTDSTVIDAIALFTTVKEIVFGFPISLGSDTPIPTWDVVPLQVPSNDWAQTSQHSASTISAVNIARTGGPRRDNVYMFSPSQRASNKKYEI